MKDRIATIWTGLENRKPVMAAVVNAKAVRYSRSARYGAFIRALRPHQWSKNLLIGVPLLLAHSWQDSSRVLDAVIAICAFCLLASVGYLINDLIDLPADRGHCSNRLRPFASGDLPLIVGVTSIPGLAVIGVALAAIVSRTFVIAAFVYLLTSIVYSLWLKRLALLDVLTLAGLYTWRILAGGAATHIEVSPWLLAFSVFIFFSLALMKRCAEIRSPTPGELPAGRGYVLGDADQLARFGTASGYIAILVLALYINSPEVRSIYAHFLRLWAVLPVLTYWISRMWLLTERGEMMDDPVLFAMTDKASYFAGAICVIVVITAL